MKIGILWLLLLSVTYAQAESELHYNVVSLEAKAERVVPNDLMRVNLQVEHEGNVASSVANKVNEDMAWALKQVKKVRSIKSQTGQYNTYPLYEKRKIRGWRASQSLVLESDNFEVLSEKIRTLQSKLQIVNMQFLPKSTTRQRVEDELIRDAIQAFKQRAALVTDSMGEEAYDVVDLNINREGGNPPVAYHNRAVAFSESLVAKSAVSAPAVSAGDSSISVYVNGRIQLK